jgi:hypothetical protein
MKKLIALFAVTTLASTSAIAAVALSGSASVSYDDNGSAASAVSTAATLTMTGTAGGTTVAASFSLEDDVIATDSVTMTSAIGPITVSADLFDEDETHAAGTDDGDGDVIDADTVDSNSTSVTVSLSAPVGDATIALDNSGDITVSGTFSGVTISHTIQDGSDSTTGSASIAGMDVSLTNDGGSTSWSIGTTVSGVALTLDSDNDISATFGLAGNTMTVSHVGARAEVAETSTHYSTEAADAYTTVAVSRSLTSGATLAATYSTSDDSLTLKASVSF